MKYKAPYHYETVRPKKIFDAAEWLVRNSPIYQDENILLDMAWKNQDWNDTTTVDFVTEHDDLDIHAAADAKNGGLDSQLDDDGDNSQNGNNMLDDWTETSAEQQFSGGNRDTMLYPNDFTSDGQHALRIAPGEGNHPINIFLDTYWRNAISIHPV